MKKTCVKRNYPSRKAAKDAIKVINRTKPGKPLKDVYWCDGCQSWHTTSMEKEQARNFKRYLQNRNNTHKKK